MLTGAPETGDLGTNSFVVQVSNPTRFVDEVTLQVSMWGVNIPPVFIAWEISGGTMQLNGLAGALRSCILQAATNFLAATDCTAAATSTAATNGAFQFTDSQSSSSGKKFHRISAN